MSRLGMNTMPLDYEVVAPIVVLAKFEAGKQLAWKGLPEVWEHVSDKSAFLGFVQTELRNFMAGSQSQLPVASPRSNSSISESPPVVPSDSGVNSHARICRPRFHCSILTAAIQVSDSS